MNTPIFEGRDIVFSDQAKDGRKRSSTVHIEAEEKIGEGQHGDIYRVIASVAKGVTGVFVIKKFKPETDKGNARESAWNAMENYQVARAYGLKVFSTYRLSADEENILMSYEANDEWAYLGSNKNSSMERLGLRKLKMIESFQNLLDSVFQEAIKAGDNGIVIQNDTYTFLVNKKSSQADFILGDTDNMRRRIYPVPSVVLAFNLNEAKTALELFIKKNMENPENYIEEVNSAYGEAMTELQLWNI